MLATLPIFLHLAAAIALPLTEIGSFLTHDDGTVRVGTAETTSSYVTPTQVGIEYVPLRHSPPPARMCMCVGTLQLTFATTKFPA